MKLTKKLINNLKSRRGGFNGIVTEFLNPPDKEKGWINRLEGKEVSEDDYNEAFSRKDSHLPDNPIFRGSDKFTASPAKKESQPEINMRYIVSRMDILEMKLDDILELLR